MTVRPAASADLPLVHALAEEYYRCDGIAFEGAALRAALERLLAEPRHGRVWIAEEGEGTCGYAVATFGFDAEMGGPLATVTDFYLRPGARGAGRGAALYAAVEARLRAEGVRAVQLHVLAHNAPALAFWPRQGFARLDRVPFLKML